MGPDIVTSLKVTGLNRENAVERFLVRYVKQQGGECRKQTGGKAWLDRMCLFDRGRMGFIETKRKGEKARADQLREVARLRRMGYHAYVVDSKETAIKAVKLILGEE